MVTEQDIRGDLHTHTDLTDGLAPLEMMAAAAERGYAYYAVTDHAPNLYMQRMTDEEVLAQRERVRALDGRHHGMRLLHGTELNIGPTGGGLARRLPPGLRHLRGLGALSLQPRPGGDDPAARTRLREPPHPRHRTPHHPPIGKRPGIHADLDEVFAACARTGTALEINAQPDRLDLGDEDILRARSHGAKFAIDTDAHSIPQLAYLRYGIGTAQRGWITPDDVINTWPLRRLRRFLRKDRAD